MVTPQDPSGNGGMSSIFGSDGSNPLGGLTNPFDNSASQQDATIEAASTPATTPNVAVDHNGLAPDFVPDWAAQMTHVGAVGVGAAIAAKKLPPISQAAKASAMARAISPDKATHEMLGNPGFKEMKQTGKGGEVFKDLKEKAGKQAYKDASKAEWRSAVNSFSPGEKAAKVGKLSENIGKKFLTEGSLKYKAAGAGSRMVGKMLVNAGSKRLAAVGLRMGLRMAAFAIPGPGWAVGAAMLAATWLFDSSTRKIIKNWVGSLFGTTTPAIDAPPNPPDTRFLPLTHDGNRDNVIRACDAQMVAINNSLFDLNPDDVWPPDHPKVETTPSFAATTNEATELMKAAADLADRIQQTMKTAQSEPLVARAAQALNPSLTSLSDLGPQVVVPIGNSVAELATKLNEAYQALRDANLKSRQEINNSSSGIWPWDYSVDASKMGNPASKAEDYNHAAKTAYETLGRAIDAWNPPKPMPGNDGTTTPTSTKDKSGKTDQSDKTDKDENTTPGAAESTPGSILPSTPSTTTTTPQTGPSSSTTPTSPSSGRDIASILKNATPLQPGTQSSPLGQNPTQQQNPFGQNPFGQNPMGTQQQNPLGQALNSGLSGFRQGLDSPMSSSMPNRQAEDLRKLFTKLSNDDNKGESASKTDKGAGDTKDKASEAKDKGGKTSAAPGATGSKDAAPKPAAGKPAAASTGSNSASNPLLSTDAKDDKDGAAKPVAATGDHPAAPGNDRTVSIDGKEVTFSDAKTAKMVQLLHPSDGSTAPTPENAATQAGFSIPTPGHDVGQPISSTQLRPGDWVVGADHTGVFLGDGKVLVDGDVRPLGDIAKFTGPHQGLFRIDADASGAGASPPPAGDASQPAAQVSGDTGSQPPSHAADPGQQPAGSGSGDHAATPPAAPGAATPQSQNPSTTAPQGADSQSSVSSILGGNSSKQSGVPGTGHDPQPPSNPRVPTGD